MLILFLNNAVCNKSLFTQASSRLEKKNHSELPSETTGQGGSHEMDIHEPGMVAQACSLHSSGGRGK